MPAGQNDRIPQIAHADYALGAVVLVRLRRRDLLVFDAENFLQSRGFFLGVFVTGLPAGGR